MDMLGGIYARGRPAPRERAVTSPQGAQGSYSASPSGRARGVGTAPGQSDTWNSAENRYYANKSACDADTQMRTRVGNSAEWTRYCANRFKGSNASAGVTQTPIAEAVAQPVPEARAAATDAYGSNGKSQADLADEAAYDARADNTWISDPVDSGGIQAREPVQATINAGQVAQWRAKESADLFLSPGDQSPVSRVSSGGCVTSTGSISGGMMQVKRADGGGVSQLFWTSISQYSLAPKWITEDICFTKVDDQSINITSNRIVP